MSAIDQIAFYQNRRDEAPNQELARKLAASTDRAGIQEMAANLGHKNQNVQSDCLKVLYEVGYLKPELIAAYVDDFLALLKSKNNRMVWGGMIALSTIAKIQAEHIWKQAENIQYAIDHGSLITVVAGIKTLSRAASVNQVHAEEIFPYLMTVLMNSSPRDVITHADNISIEVNESNQGEFIAVLEARRSEMTPAQLARLKKIMKRFEKEKTATL